jgi:hypothetical protein
VDWNHLAHETIQPPALVGSYLYIGSVKHEECIDSLDNYQLVKALIIIIIIIIIIKILKN